MTKNLGPSVDNSSIVCKHGKLGVRAKAQYKLIPGKAADFLYDKFGGGPRLKIDALCRSCVESKARKIKLRMEVAKDTKTLGHLTKELIEAYVFLNQNREKTNLT